MMLHYSETGNILGVHVNAITMAGALQAIESWVQSRHPHYICVTPAHSVMECYDHPDLREIFNHSGLTTPDGMAIVWLLHAKGFHFVERVYGPDLMRAVCKQGVEKGYRHYFYGGAPGVGEKLAAVLQQQFPGLQVVGVDSPPFRTLTKAEIDAEQVRIRAAHPDIVWVGIGSPRQEIWMSEHIDRLNVPVLVGVGAAFDFLSGNKRQAPAWVQRNGLEWFYRLISEPRRLWRRYLLGYPRFVVLVALQALGLLRFE
ncbi:MAG: WecB/TagA/CpsF family glycosyltransferase [Planctomycetes bacterium]|nr:WecB/TagA/CpsF family glycosyltransferase [Planctomycetota bacterium]